MYLKQMACAVLYPENTTIKALDIFALLTNFYSSDPPCQENDPKQNVPVQEM